jgi:hypothetical protein
MHSTILTIFPILAFCTHLGACTAFILNRRRFGQLLTWAGFVLLVLTALINWSCVHRLPVYSLYESCMHTALTLSLCLVLFGSKNMQKDVQILGSLILVLLTGLALPVLGEFNHDFFMFQVIPVQLFFALRLTAAGIALFAFVLFTTAWGREQNRNLENGQGGLRWGTIFLMLSAILFLGSELSGTFWCMLGWGDTWHWSSNFFQSAGIFLLLMLPLHIPLGWKRTSFRTGTGSLCTLLAVLAIMLP